MFEDHHNRFFGNKKPSSPCPIQIREDCEAKRSITINTLAWLGLDNVVVALSIFKGLPIADAKVKRTSLRKK